MRRFSWLFIFVLWHVCPAIGVEPAVRCLPLDEARKAMADESHEPFFSVLQPREIAAMTGTVLTGSASTGSTPAARRDEVRRRFVDAVRAFTPEEDAALVEMTNHLRGLLEPRYPLMAREPWRYVKFDRGLVGGFPHTRGPWIFLSDRVVERFVEQWKSIQEKHGNVAGLTTLLHEQMHVLERKYPERFRKLYVDVYGFRFGPVRDDPWIAARRISNPDALRWEWVFPVKREGKEQFFAPQMLLRDGPEVPRMGADFQFACVKVEPDGDGFRVVHADGKPIVHPLSEVPEYVAAMPIRGGLDHPNELTAYLFEQIFISDVTEQGATPLEKGVAAAKRAIVGLKPEVEQVRTWFRANLR